MRWLYEEGYREAARITRGRAKSFSFASVALGPETRRAAFAVYAFCRRCDDTVDEAKGLPRATLQARVDDLRAQVEGVYLGRHRGDPILAAFSEVVRARAVPKRALLELIDGMEQDLDKRRYETWQETMRYCDLAAGTVGRVMASVFGVSRESALDEATALGCAMQLTNILRDVREDLLEHDRVYLPRIALEADGISETHLRAWSSRGGLDGSREAEGMRGLIRAAAHRARALYEQADAGVPAIVTPAGRACVRLMRATYSEILAVLEARGWDPFAGRASTSLGRKASVGARALLGVGT